jgi:hypothetical protein
VILAEPELSNWLLLPHYQFLQPSGAKTDIAKFRALHQQIIEVILLYGWEEVEVVAE